MVALKRTTMALHNDIGVWGEETAANLLNQKGYQIRERNWRTGHWEVDIIAEDKQYIVFVEVKTRSSSFGDKLPEEYVDKDKERLICMAAQVYVKRHSINKDIRFDIVSLLVDPSTHSIRRLEHIEEAFYPPLRTIHAGSYSGYKRKNQRRAFSF